MCMLWWCSKILALSKQHKRFPSQRLWNYEECIVFYFFTIIQTRQRKTFCSLQQPRFTSSWEPFQLYSMHSCQQGSVFSCNFRVFAAEMTHLLPHHPSAAPLQQQSSASNRLFWPLYPSQRDGSILAEGLRHLIRFPNPIVLSHGSRCNSVSHYLIPPPPTPTFSFSSAHAHKWQVG